MSAERRLQLGVGLIAAAVIGYEIGLVRLFSFLQHYHYTFLVVSGAVCGLGLGAALSAVLRTSTSSACDSTLHRHLGDWAGGCGVSMICGAFAVAEFPRMSLLLLVGIAGLPFIAAGAFLALAFRARYQQSQVLYFWDLVGAALGILYVVPALEWLGGVGALLGASVFAMAAAAFFLSRWVWTCPIVLTTGLVVYSFQQRELIDLSDLAATGDKPMFRALGAERHRGEVKDTRWSAYARTDLVDRTGDTGLNLYVDGGAGSYMFRFPGDYRRLFFVRREAAFFPYYFSPRERTLIIGPGGGADVLYALMTGWRHIEAVEINPEIAALVRSYGEYNGHLYDLEGVELHIGDGRNYLERSRVRYDLIALPLVYAEAADLVGYALSENYLFTREAFAAYLDHLAEGGRLALIVHNHALMLRVVATLGALWEERGHEPSAVLDHLVVINGARGDPVRQEAHRPLLLVQQQPYTSEQLARLHAVMEELGLDAYFSPGRRERPALAALRGATLADFVAASALDISPTTDDRPFFYDAARGLDSKLTRLLIGALLACMLVMLVPLGAPSMRQRVESGPPPLLWALFAAGLGTGFMMVEIHLLQRFGLFLGYPTLTLAVALFGLLLGTGAGSLVGGWCRPLAHSRGLGLIGVVVGLVCYLYGFLLDGALVGALAWPLTARVGLTLALVAPLGMLLGTCFPACLRLGGSQRAGIVPWLWAVNGFFSVLGSVGAVALGMEWGASASLAVGAAAYLVAGLALFLGSRRTSSDVEITRPSGAGRWAVGVLLLVALLWYAAFSFIGVRYWGAAPSAGHPRPPVAAEVWPDALRDF